MRVSETQKFNAIIANFRRAAQRTFNSQNQVSSGKKLNTPSDNPVAYASKMRYDQSLSKAVQYRRNIDSSLVYINITDDLLNSTTSLITRAKEIAVAQANSTMNASIRTSAAIEARSIMDQLVAIGNTRIGERYMFSGYLTDTAPFDTDGAYSGDTGEIEIQVSDEITVPLNINGDELFKGGTTGIDIFGVMDDLITSLNNNDITAIESTISDFDTSTQQVINTRIQVGARMNLMEDRLKTLDSEEFEITKVSSELTDVDMIKAVSELVANQTAMETAQAVAARVMSTSLLDFLR